MNADEAMQKLREGNERFVKNMRKDVDFERRRRELLAGQQPWATVLGCADSRIVANFIFDTDLGEIFTVKNAGNLADDDITLGSLEYGCEHLHTPLLVVLGHQGCGAVAATCKTKGKSEEGHIKNIVNSIAPSAQKNNFDVDKCIKCNVLETVKAIPKKSKMIAKLQEEGKLKIVGAYYSMETGRVEFLH
ncbi:MAG: carbonic anhydrase [Candidatus Micrarchaeia archaeon]